VTCDASLSPVVKYHGLARRYLHCSGFLMRPLLNGGTLGGRETLRPRKPMPSIEILCVGLAIPEPPPATSFAVISDPSRRSHRGPTPRFQSDFDRLDGVLYHVGNPEFASNPDGPFFAYDVLSEASRDASPSSFLEFAPSHAVSARSFLEWILASSPAGQLLFTSDWQFGPSRTRRFDGLDLNEFWRRHDSRRLFLNSAYVIDASQSRAAAGNTRDKST
jgi:hypothetical protein